MTGQLKRRTFGEPGKVNDGRWHAVHSFSYRPIAVPTMRGTQRHMGSRAMAQRWTGTRWEYKTCGDIHKKRSTTIQCSEWLAHKLNKEMDNGQA